MKILEYLPLALFIGAGALLAGALVYGAIGVFPALPLVGRAISNEEQISLLVCGGEVGGFAGFVILLILASKYRR